MWERLPWAIAKAAFLGLLMSGLWLPQPDRAVSPTYLCVRGACQQVINTRPDTTPQRPAELGGPAPTRPTTS